MASKSAELLLRIKTAGEESLDKLKSGFAEIGKAGMVAFAAISAIVVKSLTAYREAEEAQNALTRSMVNAGVYSKSLAADYKKQADALAAVTTFEDDAITAAQATLQTHLKGIAITPQLTKAVLDLAAAKKMDLSSAAELVGKTIGTETNALARQGIQISDTTDKNKRLAEVVHAVNSSMGGQAEAAAKGLGVFDQLKNSVGNLFEELGGRLAPMFGVIGNILNKLANDTSQTSGAMDMFVAIIDRLARAAVVTTAFVDIFTKSIGAGLATAFEAVNQAAHGSFSQAVETVKSGLQEISDEALVRTNTMYNQLDALDAAAVQKKKETQETETQDLITSLENKKQIRIEAEAAESSRQLEQDIAGQQLAMQMINANEEQKLAALIAWNDKKIAATTNAREKEKLLTQKYNLQEQQIAAKLRQEQIDLEQKKWNAIAGLTGFMAGAVTNIMGKESQLAMAMNKAAALAQAMVATQQAAAMALTLGPIAGPPMAGFVTALGYANMAAIAGVRLAEGGIVRARPGGIQATIGEGGQDEMVVPLDRAAEFGLGGGGGGATINITVYGGLLGSESDAHEFAKAIDREMLKLRQNNESVAFDSRVS